MAWKKGFNFRETSAYVTDGTDETYVIGTVTGPATMYPVTRNSVTFGYTNGSGSSPQDRNRNSALDRRLAGTHFWTGDTGYPGLFRVDLPATGDYKIRIAGGDAYGSRSTGFVQVRDNTTAKITIDHASGFTSGATFRDATDVDRSSASWPGSNVQVTATFATTTLIVALGKYGAGGSADGWIAHLEVEQVETGSTGTFAQTLATVTLAAVTTALAVGTLAATLGAATLSAAATAPSTGTATPTLAPVTLAATGTAGTTGSLTATLAPVTGTAAATAPITGTLARTLDGIGLSAAGVFGTPILGSLGQTLGAVTLTASGTVVTPSLGTLTQTVGPVTLAATGTVTESGLPPEPIEEQILAAIVARLTEMPTLFPGFWYVPKFVARAYRPLDSVNELPGYLVLRAPEESGMELQTIDYPGSAIIAAMGLEILAYGQGSDVEPTDRVLIRLLAQAERALMAPGLFGDEAAPENQIELQNTRRVLDHETEVGAPYRSLMSHLYRVRYFYTRGEP